MTTLRSRARSSRCRGFTDERSPRDVDARHVAHRRLERSAFVRCLSAIRVLQARATTATGLPFRNGSEHVVRACPRLAYPRGTAAALRYPCQRERRTRHEGTRATRCSPRTRPGLGRVVARRASVLLPAQLATAAGGAGMCGVPRKLGAPVLSANVCDVFCCRPTKRAPGRYHPSARVARAERSPYQSQCSRSHRHGEAPVEHGGRRQARAVSSRLLGGKPGLR